ncbi:MAG TPA: agmatinase [Lachnospiraceae bacterium]|nr:agmatinase [Lachnospiraceae bacterium]
MGKYHPPSASSTPRFAGIKTFMRLPYVKTQQDIDFAIVGIPFDTGACFKVGARFGPGAIREASALMRNFNMNLNVDIFEYLSGVDYGDIDIVPGFIHETYSAIEEGLTPLFDANVMPISLGGDHSITLGELRAASKKYGPVALVHFDSHLDTWDQYWGMKYTHGTPFRRACEEGLIDTEHSIQIGIRGSQYSPQDIQDSEDLGFKVVTANEIHEMGISETGKIIRERVKDANAFLSFDIDFCDPSCAPGTGTIEIGGFSGYESIALVREMQAINFIAMDLVEVLPIIDPSGRTAYMAGNIIHEVLAMKALQKK